MEGFRVLIVGAGSIGERHARCFLRAGAPSVSICEVRAERRAALRERYPLEAVYESFEQVPLEKFDAVIVCVPAHLHVEVSVRALDGGCHVLCEKPLALSTDDADRLLQTVARTDRVAAVAYVYRSIPAAARLRELLQQGRIGVVRHVMAFVGQEFPRFRPDYREIYYSSHATGGGAIHDALSHIVNYVQWCIGLEQRVWCAADHFVLEGVGVEDTATITLYSPARFLASLNMNQFQKPNEVRLEFAGEKGSLALDMEGWRVGIFGNDSWQWESYPIERDDAFVAQAKNFLAAIEGREPVRCTIQEGYETLRTIEAAHQSWRSGAEIHVR